MGYHRRTQVLEASICFELVDLACPGILGLHDVVVVVVEEHDEVVVVGSSRAPVVVENFHRTLELGSSHRTPAVVTSAGWNSAVVGSSSKGTGGYSHRTPVEEGFRMMSADQVLRHGDIPSG